MADSEGSNDLRKRNVAATKPRPKKRKDDDGEIDERGRTKLNVFLLLLILGVPILTGVIFAFEYIANTRYVPWVRISITIGAFLRRLSNNMNGSA